MFHSSTCCKPNQTRYDADGSKGARQAYKACFERWDDNGDGFLSIEELRAGLSLLGVQLTCRRFALVVREIDTSVDGCIDYAEFYSAFASREDQMSSLLTMVDQMQQVTHGQQSSSPAGTSQHLADAAAPSWDPSDGVSGAELAAAIGNGKRIAV